MNMNEFARRTAREAGCTIPEAKQTLLAAFTILARALAEGENVIISNVGTFYASERPARWSRNPATGGKVWVEAGKVAKFRPSGALARAVRDGDVNASVRKPPAGVTARFADRPAEPTDKKVMRHQPGHVWPSGRTARSVVEEVLAGADMYTGGDIGSCDLRDRDLAREYLLERGWTGPQGCLTKKGVARAMRAYRAVMAQREGSERS